MKNFTLLSTHGVRHVQIYTESGIFVVLYIVDIPLTEQEKYLKSKVLTKYVFLSVMVYHIPNKTTIVIQVRFYCIYT